MKLDIFKEKNMAFANPVLAVKPSLKPSFSFAFCIKMTGVTKQEGYRLSLGLLIQFLKNRSEGTRISRINKGVFLVFVFVQDILKATLQLAEMR
jgi:hypothetical protein